MDRFVFYFIVLAICISGSAQLRCVPCPAVSCPTVKSLKCQYGYELDVCQCCPRCLKGIGQSCGGAFFTHGHCTKGAFCRTTITFPQKRLNTYLHPDGICRPLVDS